MKTLMLFFAALLMMNTDMAFSSPETMKKVGTGQVKYLGFIKVYDAQLLIGSEVTAGSILDEDISKCLILKYAVDLTAADLAAGAEAVLKRQHPREVLDNVRVYIDNINSAYVNVGSGDSYALCYDKTLKTTTLILNGRQAASIVSADFARIYFGIWLGPEHVLDESLRQDLLSNLVTH